jgi:hypothetical protein
MKVYSKLIQWIKRHKILAVLAATRPEMYS